MCDLIDSKLASNKVVVSFSLSHHRDANYSERDVCGVLLFLFGQQKKRALIITVLTTSFYTANAMKKKEE